LKIERVCSECGSTEVQTGEFKGYGALFKKRIVVKSSPVDACFCVNCGFILLLKVRNPEKIV
jgi:predicted nucleic-acid-binding Zn-ribbon protein